MKIGCGTVLFRQFPLENALDAIRNAGFSYFETQAVGPWCPHIDVEKDDPEKIVRLKNEFGFEGITALWSYGGSIIADTKSVERQIRSIEWAAAAGIPVVHTGDGHKPADMDTDTAFQTLEEKLSVILECAEKNNIMLAVEPHGTFSLTLAGLRRILALGKPSVLGVNYDAANVLRSGFVESKNGTSGYKCENHREDELAVCEGIAHRIVHMHAKDVDKDLKCVAVGEGMVKNKACIDHLRSLHYDGVISLETDGGGSFEDICLLAKKSYAYLNTIING